MSFVPYAAIWVLLVVAAGVALLVERRPKLPAAITLATSILTITLWFLFRPATVAPSLTMWGRHWAVEDAAWALTGIALLLVLTVALYSLLTPALTHLARRSALSAGMAAAALPSVWAADDRTRILGLTLFAVVWAIAHWYKRRADDAPFDLSGDAVRLLAATFPLWAAVALPAGRALLGVLSASILMGLWPFGRWRGNGSPGALARHGFPVVVGAAVLAASLGSGTPSSVELAVGTAAGLLSMLVGLGRAWERPAEMARSLGLGLIGLMVVVAVWAGEDALLAAARVAVFAPVLMGLASTSMTRQGKQLVFEEDRPASGLRLLPQLASLAVVFAAVAGLPLTAGFGALPSLYESWRGAAGWVLLLVAVVLISLWLAALYLFARGFVGTSPADGADRLRGLALIPPAIGLISLDFAVSDFGLTTWLAILIPVAAGVLLGQFAPGLAASGGLLREAFALPQPLAATAPRVRAAVRWVADAIADALSILEGDNGLLWLLGLLLLLIWIA